MRIIPTPVAAYPNTSMSMALSGVTYRVWWLWNERDGCWYFSMRDVDGASVVESVRVVLNAALLAGGSAENRPPYELVLWDPSGKGRHPDRTTLAALQLVYLEPDA